jgi:hydroxymethylbilane synthase
MHFRIGTRGSRLALWQAELVAKRLQAQQHTTELVIIETKGDKILNVSLSKIGSKGIFTQELEEQLRENNIDIAVHSAKDLQSELPEDLEIIAFTEREQVHDVVLSFDAHFSMQTKNSVIGTSSTRRRAQLQRYYPHIRVVESRGNLQTRIKKLENGDCEALILAYAGVFRMQYDHLIVANLPITQFTPPVGQGSVAIEATTQLDANKKAEVIKALNHAPTAHCLIAERSFLKDLQGGCSVPVFGYAHWVQQKIRLKGGIISLEGRTLIEAELEGTNPVELGQKLAQEVIEQGGKDLLQAIKNQIHHS